jgi:hypothetical protein
MFSRVARSISCGLIYAEEKKLNALRLRNTQKAICQLTYSIKDYYNNNHKSMKL